VAPGIRVETDEIQSILLGDVLKRDVLEGKVAEHGRTRVKKASGRSLKKRRPKRKSRRKEAIGPEASDLSDA